MTASTITDTDIDTHDPCCELYRPSPPPAAPPDPGDLAARAARKRAETFAANAAGICHVHRALPGEPCWVEPDLSSPGAGTGVGFLPGQDRPQVCDRRRRIATETLETEDRP